MKKFFYIIMLSIAVMVPVNYAQAAERNNDRSSVITERNLRLINSGLGVVLPQDMSKAQLEIMQRSLRQAGYFKSTVDGKWGPKLNNAVINFKRDHGLGANNQLSTSTLAQLGFDVAVNTSAGYQNIEPAAGDTNNDNDAYNNNALQRCPDSCYSTHMNKDNCNQDMNYE